MGVSQTLIEQEMVEVGFHLDLFGYRAHPAGVGSSSSKLASYNA